MMAKQNQAISQLFTVRVWREEVGDGRFEMRGTIKHVISGETHHFHDLAKLTQLIENTGKPIKAEAPGGKK